MKLLKIQTAVLFVLLSALFTPSCVKELDSDDCNCLNGGTCIGYTCDCPPDYTGVNCEIYVGGTGNTCSIVNQALSKSQIETALQGFAYDGTNVTKISEAQQMLKYICPSIVLHAGNGEYTCGRLSNGWHITIWINTYGKTNTYGIRYSQADNHSHWSSNNTYFEITKGSSGNTATQTVPNTIFKGTTSNSLNTGSGWWTESFTISSTKNLVLRFASTYAADCAVITPDQENSFKNGGSFTGYAVFDNQFGYKSVTLPAGNYLLAVRNQSGSANTFTAELDYQITLPASDQCSYFDEYIKGAPKINAKQYYYHDFTVQAGFRYFVDGCNSGMYVFFIPENQLSTFLSGGAFQHFQQYSNPAVVGMDPGLYEIKLPPGKYYLAAYNFSNVSEALVYTMERWKQN